MKSKSTYNPIKSDLTTPNPHLAASLNHNSYTSPSRQNIKEYKGTQNSIVDSITKFYNHSTLIHINERILNLRDLLALSYYLRYPFDPVCYRSVHNLKDGNNRESDELN